MNAFRGALIALVLGLLAAACDTTTAPRAEQPASGDDDGDGGEGQGARGTGGDAHGGSGGSSRGGSGGAAGCSPGADPFDPAALEASVQFLASDELAGRAPGTPGDVAARGYIEARFACIGLLPGGADGSYQQPFVTSYGPTTGNVVGLVPGSDPALAGQIVVVGGHHDHLGVIGGEIYNGANDNASGSATVMAIAQAVMARNPAPRRTVAFVTFGSEENDETCEGSEFFCASPPAAVPIADVVYMVNLDMVGTYPDEQLLSAYGSFPGTPGRTILEGLLGDHPALNVELGGTAEEDDSDFQAFSDHGIPYVYFAAEDDHCYHSPCDDADRIDYPSMADVATLAFEVVLGLADADSL